MTADLALVARIITEGFLPARLALMQGPPEPAQGVIDADRIRGMLLGLAIGDSLGNTSEGLTPAERNDAHGEIRDYLPNRHAGHRRVGLPSDDSQLAFWTLESLLEHDTLDPEDLATRFASQRIFGIGKAVGEFRERRTSGVAPWFRCGTESAGNGALMRIAPVVLLHPHGSGPGLWLDAALASIVTHRDPASVASCVAFAELLSRLLRLPSAPPSEWFAATFLDTAKRVCTDHRYRPRGGQFQDREGAFPDYLGHVLGEAQRHGWSTREACDAWYSGAFLLETVPSVLWILERHGHDPEEAIVRAVNDTKDNDTVAAIVGAAMGALHGAQALPRRWKLGLVGRTQAADDGQVFRLVETAARRWG